jgi:succinate-semialdehyde dehydrogenase / glutarate-semialdehyde dehydrogenase
MRMEPPNLIHERCLIDGVWTGEPETAVTNPASGATIARVPNLGAEGARRAIEAAHRAFPGWSGLLAKERAAILRRWFDLQLKYSEDLAQIMTAEQGKPISESRGEVAYGASFVEFFAEEAKRIYGETIPAHKKGGRIIVHRQPVGVVGAITPWNFPLAMITRKVAPALAVGCACVVKPAPDTPLTALALGELALQAGVPPGVLNIVTGDADAIGKELTTNPHVRAIAFTGSTRVGKLLMAQAASTVKRVSLELGGNAPFIVFDDADLDKAVEGAIACKYRNMGQTCVCANRILVQDGVYDDFAEKLAHRVSHMRVGPGAEEGVTQGPLINEAGLAKVEAHVADALAKGAKAIVGGKRHALGRTFFEPTVLVNAHADMRLAAEETFGPVAPLFRFKQEDAAIRFANATPYGLAAYFYSRDVARVFRVTERLEFGIVGVNDGIISTEVAPFGGVKESGLGREGSRHGVEEFLEMKYMFLGGLSE